jgi:hypothetical protein
MYEEYFESICGIIIDASAYCGNHSGMLVAFLLLINEI